MIKTKIPTRFILIAFCGLMISSCVTMYVPPTEGDLAKIDFVGNDSNKLQRIFYNSYDCTDAKAPPREQNGTTTIYVPRGKPITLLFWGSKISGSLLASCSTLVTVPITKKYYKITSTTIGNKCTLYGFQKGENSNLEPIKNMTKRQTTMQWTESSPWCEANKDFL